MCCLFVCIYKDTPEQRRLLGLEADGGFRNLLISLSKSSEHRDISSENNSTNSQSKTSNEQQRGEEKSKVLLWLSTKRAWCFSKIYHQSERVCSGFSSWDRDVWKYLGWNPRKIKRREKCHSLEEEKFTDSVLKSHWHEMNYVYLDLMWTS